MFFLQLFNSTIAYLSFKIFHAILTWMYLKDLCLYIPYIELLLFSTQPTSD